MPNIECIEVRIEETIGAKELGESLDYVRAVNYGHSCKRILPTLLKALSNTTLQIKRFYICFTNVDHRFEERWIAPWSSYRRWILSPQTLRAAFGDSPAQLAPIFSSLEYLSIIPSEDFISMGYDRLAFNAIRQLLETTACLRNLELKHLGPSQGPSEPFLSDLLPRTIYPNLTHVSLKIVITDHDYSLVTFLGKHSKTLETVRLDHITIVDKNRAEEMWSSHGTRNILQRLRNNYEFPALKSFKKVEPRFISEVNPGKGPRIREHAPYLLRITAEGGYWDRV